MIYLAIGLIFASIGAGIGYRVESYRDFKNGAAMMGVVVSLFPTLIISVWISETNPTLNDFMMFSVIIGISIAVFTLVSGIWEDEK